MLLQYTAAAHVTLRVGDLHYLVKANRARTFHHNDRAFNPANADDLLTALIY